VLGKTYDDQYCSAARTLGVVGERWTLLIVRDAAFAGARRFSDFQKSLGVATNILTTRLDGLVEAGIMRRHRYSKQPELYEYLLTDKGRELVPVIVALTEWGDRWMSPDGPPVYYVHSACGGGATREQLTCETCGEVHDAAEVVVRMGQGMPADRIAQPSP